MPNTNYKIREYRVCDKENLRNICKETAWDSYKSDPNKLESVPILFNDYFTEQEPEYVFVIADQNDTAKGYIICSADYEKFKEKMYGDYLEKLNKYAPEEKTLLDGFMDNLEKIKDKPVHFHMDMLPECQHMGFGTKLIYTLCNRLLEDGYDSLSACCIREGAASYNLTMKLGFEKIYDYGDGVVSLNFPFEKHLDKIKPATLNTMRKRISDGKLFTDYCEGLPQDRLRAKKLMKKLNDLEPDAFEERAEILEEIFQKPTKAWIEPPFYFCYGYNINLGENTYINFNCNFVDDGKIIIGNRVMFGPNVTIATVGHPLDPKMREYMYTAPVKIGNDVWIGGNVTICPGVTIGDGCVIGAGSVVTSDIPENSIAVGNPCRVLREINEHDKEYYFRDRKINKEDLAEERNLRN